MHHKVSSKKMKRGFTLIELLLSVVILAILMVATAEIFSRSSVSYRATREFETSVGEAQFLMNALAKELRTSTVVAPTGDGATQNVKFFEYSKSECVQYRFNGTTQRLEVARTASTTFATCNNTSDLSGFVPASNALITGSFFSLPSLPLTPGPGRMGRVTLTLSIQASGVAPVVLQTTVSLRDYGYAGLQ
jgi:prepilin-type N-terminal cleavage/methylation domain-containing protein